MLVAGGPKVSAQNKSQWESTKEKHYRNQRLTAARGGLTVLDKRSLRVLNQVIPTTPLLYTAIFNSTGTDFDESFPGDIRHFADAACEA